MTKAMVALPREDHKARRIMQHGTKDHISGLCYRCGEQPAWFYRRYNGTGKHIGGGGYYVCDRHLPVDMRPPK